MPACKAGIFLMLRLAKCGKFCYNSTVEFIYNKNSYAKKEKIRKEKINETISTRASSACRLLAAGHRTVFNSHLNFIDSGMVWCWRSGS